MEACLSKSGEKSLCIQVHGGEYFSKVHGISSKHTISDVRSMIVEQFDEDMLPNESKDFFFNLSKEGRLTKKQEATIHAWDVLKDAQDVTIQARDSGGKKQGCSSSSQDRSKKPLGKRVRRFLEEVDSDDHSDATTVSEDDDETTISTEGEDGGTSDTASDEKKAVCIKNLAGSEYDEAVCHSRKVMKSCLRILHENYLFFESVASGLEEQLNTWLRKTTPETKIGCIGLTGAGKSSMLNALLDEASVLPTSGTVGCTAAAIELRFNRDLLMPHNDEDEDSAASSDWTCSVYKATIEFLSLEEWGAEAQILLEECCDPHTKHVTRPIKDPEAAASWNKLEHVYGRSIMDQLVRKTNEEAWDILVNDEQILDLLGSESRDVNKRVEVHEGSANLLEAKLLCGPLSQLGLRNKTLAAKQRELAESFRNQINDYVCQKGDGNQRQTWPLIRRCVLFGPWQVLSSGACLVDLPGVKDSNAARAKVADSYLPECDFVWIVTSIKRAVDCKTSKDLVSEQFGRELLMDGHYCNVRVICSQTDDCEPDEIMRGHEDVARQEEGRWEEMMSILNEIARITCKIENLSEREKQFQRQSRVMEREIRKIRESREQKAHLTSDSEADDNSAFDTESTENEKKKEIDDIDTKRAKLKSKVEKLQNQSKDLQKKLKAMAAIVRNEYSTARLQKDFRAWLEEELTPDLVEEELADPDAGGDDESLPPPPLPHIIPDDFELAVNCISANDYLKITKRKSKANGEPNTFFETEQTQIPALRAAVHDTTLQYRQSFSVAFAKKARELLDRICLVVVEAQDCTDGSIPKALLESTFENEMQLFEASNRNDVVSEFEHNAASCIGKSLKPSLERGAHEGKSGAHSTALSWGSARKKCGDNEAGPRGLRYHSYRAVMRRDGRFISTKAGYIDLNYELYSPMEKELTGAWSRTMTALATHLDDAHKSATRNVGNVLRELRAKFTQHGASKRLTNSMSDLADRACRDNIASGIALIQKGWERDQRQLHREILPILKERMSPGYRAAVNVAPGKGAFHRMKEALVKHVDVSSDMFDQAALQILEDLREQIDNVSQDLADLTGTTEELMERAFLGFLNANDTDKLELVHKQTRRNLQDELNSLCQDQSATLSGIGVTENGSFDREESDDEPIPTSATSHNIAAATSYAVDV